jgi:MFS family permease
VTVPIALAVIASGYLQLERTPSARSWNTVGPGIAMLLAPSLIATAFEQPVWRLVALGVVAIAVMVVGAVRRLQAPFVLGAAFTLVHVLATFSDEIRAVYESAHWLLWAAIGGVLLIVLAARYEQRVQNLKSIVLRVTSLR